VTGWSLGEAGDLLGKYAWYLVNASGQTHSVGVLWPNDWGLFDLHGNVMEWCQDKDKPVRSTTTETSRPTKENLDNIVDPKSSRVLRGSGFTSTTLYVRSANRSNQEAAYRNGVCGFRPARTYR
jgi:formylglycine-generating enzyme required for sulfatase activity